MRRATAHALCTPAGASARRSNREVQLLESILSCSKQTALDSPNREKNTSSLCRSARLRAFLRSRNGPVLLIWDMQSVTMAGYDPRWPEQFKELRDRIAAAMGPLVLAIEHVGSTSVPNMCAKPIIDLDVIVRPEDVPAAISAVEALGYRHEGNLGVNGREAFRWVAEFPEHHLYVCPQGSPALERHLLVRDYLRRHPEAAREYAEVKRQLAQKYHDNRTKYQAAKAEFVDALMEKARQELGKSDG